MLCWFLLYNMNQSYVYMYSLPLGSPAHPPSHPSRSSQSTRMSSLYCTATSHQLSVLNMVMHIFQCYSLSSSHSPLPPLRSSLCSTSAFLFLPWKQVHSSLKILFPLLDIFFSHCNPNLLMSVYKKILSGLHYL